MRTLLKRAVQYTFAALVLPAALLAGFGRVTRMYLFFAHSFALLPGFLGEFSRAAYYRLTLRNCSPDVVIGFGSFFSRTSATVGPNVSIGAFCVVGSASIGERTQIASHVEIPSGRHQHARDESGNLGEAVDDEVLIGPRCWIGASAVILANVGSGTTVGAGSVVVKDLPENVVAVGNPARVVRQIEIRAQSATGQEN